MKKYLNDFQSIPERLWLYSICFYENGINVVKNWKNPSYKIFFIEQKFLNFYSEIYILDILLNIKFRSFGNK